MIHRLDSPGRYAYASPKIAGATNNGCLPCAGGDHSHAARKSGPYLICHCLGCPDLVV